MLKPILLAGLAVAVLTPSLASAQTSCQHRKSTDRVIGTVVGAGIGALLGNAIAEHGGKPGGTIIGGVGGGVAGNVIAGSSVHCDENRYGYYDSNGRWVPNTSTNYGYYDADGRWVDTAPGGVGARGDYAPPPAGYAPPPAEYAPPPPGPHADNDRRDFRDHGDYVGGQEDVASREASLEEAVRQRMDDGSLGRGEGRRALRELRQIRRDDVNARDEDNRLSPDQEADLQRRLDEVASRVGEDRRAEYDHGAPAY